MADENWAIIVGIWRYPGLKSGDLEGAHQDAQDFRAWVVSAGGVPEANARQFLSPERVAGVAPFHGPLDAKPTEILVRDVLMEIQDRAHQNAQSAGQRRVGQRLYLYLAGHGFCPDAHDTGLLMANADEDRQRLGTGFHVLGEWTAEWFYKAGYFDEVLLFMDCCRVTVGSQMKNQPFAEEEAADYQERVKRFYAYATKWSRTTREVPVGGRQGGVFTAALLKGLQGAATEPGSGGQITARSLKEYLKAHMKDLLPEALQKDDSVPKLPDIPTDDDFCIVSVTDPTFPVTVPVPAAMVGQPVEILDSAFAQVASLAAAPSSWILRLEPSYYLLHSPAGGPLYRIEVKDQGGVDVHL